VCLVESTSTPTTFTTESPTTATTPTISTVSTVTTVQTSATTGIIVSVLAHFYILGCRLSSGYGSWYKVSFKVLYLLHIIKCDELLLVFSLAFRLTKLLNKFASVRVWCREYKYSDDVYHRVADNGNYTDHKHSQYGNNGANIRDYRYYRPNQRFGAFLLPLHAMAMERYCHRMASVRLSVTLVDCDHIRWARWNFITRLISPSS